MSKDPKERIEEFRARTYHKLSRFAEPHTFKFEYRNLIEDIGKYFINPAKANHKGLADVAGLLGISPHTLKGRLREGEDSKGVTTEMVLAALFVRDHQYIPGKPMTDAPDDMIAWAIVEANTPISTTDIQSKIMATCGVWLAKTTITGILHLEGESDDPRWKRWPKRGMYVPFNWIPPL